jgi:GAF domain-containing protein
VIDVRSRTQDLVTLVKQLADLPEITQAINAGQDLPEVLQAIAVSTVSVVRQGASATINLWRQEAGTLCPVAADGPHSDFLMEHPPRPDGIGMQVFRQGKPVVERRRRKVEEVVSDAARENDVRAFACFPVKAGDEVLGTLYVDYRGVDLPEYFSENELTMLSIVADQAAVAISNAQLLEKATQRASQLESLTKTMGALNAALELEDLLQQIADSTVEIVQGDASATINLLQEEEGRLWPEAAAGPHSQFLLENPPRPDGIGMQVFNAGEPFVERQVEEVEEIVSEKARAEEVRAFACYPVKIGNRVLGTLYVDYRGTDQPQYFTEAELSILPLFADQAALAIERARQLDILTRVVEAINAAHDLPDVLQRIADGAVQLIRPGGSATINLWREQAEKLLPLAAAGRHSQFLLDNPPRPDGIGMQVFTDGQPVVERRPERVEAVVSEKARQNQVRAFACYPVKVGDDVLGTLYVDYRGDELPEYFAANELALLEIFADQAAIAISNARLMEEEKQRAAQLEELTEIARALNAALGLRDVLQCIADSTVKIVQPGAAATINLWQEDQDRLWPEAAAGPHRQFLLDNPPRPDGIGMQVFEEGELVVECQPAAVDAVVSEKARKKEVRAFACLPVKVRDRVLGTLYVDYRNVDLPEYFTSAELAMLSIFADQAAVAIERARQLKSLTDVMRAINTARSLPDVLQSIADNTVRLIRPGASATINLWQGERLQPQAAAGPARDQLMQPPSRHGIGAQVFHTGEPIVRHEPGEIESEEAKKIGVLALACLPVKVTENGEEQFLGILYVDYRDVDLPDYFAASEMAVLEIFADQAAMAIEKVRLLEDARRKTDQLNVLTQAVRTINKDLDLASVLESIVESTVRIVRPQASASIDLWNEGEGKLLPEATAGPRKDHLKEVPPRPDGISMTVYQTQNRRVLCGDEINQYAVQGSREEGVLAFACLPVKFGGRVVGTLYVEYRPEHIEDVEDCEDSATVDYFSADEVEMLSRLADHAAVAIRNAQLFNAREESLRLLESLHQVGTSLVRLRFSADLEEILEEIANQAREVLKIDVVTLYQFDEKEGQFLVEGVGPTVSGDLRDPRDNVMKQQVNKDDIPWRIVKAGGNRYFPNAQNDPDVSKKTHRSDGRRPFVEREGIASSAALLLQVERETFGSEIVGVMFANYRSYHEFPREEKQVLETFANYAAIAIQNARLLDERQQMKLHRVLSRHFSYDELHNLCLDLGVPFENLPGTSRDAKARELVLYLQRRGRILELFKQIRLLRPNAEL